MLLILDLSMEKLFPVSNQMMQNQAKNRPLESFPQ